MRRCESCGKVFPESKDVFCPHCGAIATSKQVCGCDDSSNMARYTRANNGQPVNRDPYGTGARHNDHAPAGVPAPSPSVRTQQRVPAKQPANPKKLAAIIFAVVFVCYFMFAVMNAMEGSFDDNDNPYEETIDYGDTADFDRFYAFGSATDERRTVTATSASVKFIDDRLYLCLGDLCDPNTLEPVLPVDDISDIAFLWCRGEEGEAYLPDEFGFMRYCDDFYDNAFGFQYIDLPDDGSFCRLSNVEAVTYEDGYEDCSHFEVELPFDAVTVENGQVLYWMAEVTDDNTVTFTPLIHA